MFIRWLAVAPLCALVAFAFVYSSQAQQPPAALEGHTGGASDAVYSPDGKLIATSSFDGTLKIWDAATGTELRTLEGHNGQVLSLAVSPDGRQLASGGRDNSVKLWDFYIPTPLTQWPGHEGAVQCVASHSEGTWWASGGADKTVKIWDPTDGKALFDLARHEAAVTGLAVNKDNTQLATADAIGIVRFWNPADGTAMGILGADTSSITALAFHPNVETPLLMTAAENGSVKLWSLPPKPPVALTGHTEAVTAVAMSSDASLVATGGADASVRLFTPGAETPPRVLAGQLGPVTSLALNMEAKIVATGNDMGVVKLWNLDDGADRLTLTGHAGPVHDVAISPKGDGIATAGEDGTLRLWRLPAAPAALAGHTMPVTAVAISGDGKLIATTSADKLIKLFNAADGMAVQNITTDTNAAHSIAFNPSNDQVAAGNVVGEIHLLSTVDGADGGSLAGHTGPVTYVEYHPDGKQLLSAGKDGTLRWWNLPPSPGRALPDAAGAVRRLALSVDGKQVVVGSADGAIRIVDATTAQPAGALEGHVGEVTALAASAAHIASGDAQGVIGLWSATDGSALPSLAGHAGAVTDLAFHPQGEQVVSAGEDGTLRVWKLPTPIKSLPGAAMPVDVAAFSADGSLVASAAMAGGKPTIVVRDTTTGAVKATLLGHDAAVTALAFSADKTKIISGSADKTARAWNLADPKFPELAKYEGHAVAVTCVAFSADAAQAFSGAADGGLKQWTVSDGVEFRALAGHTGAVTSLAVAGTTLVSGSADTSVRQWNITNGAAIRALNHAAAVGAVAISSDGKIIASAGADKTVKLWNAADGAALATLTGAAEAVSDVAISGDSSRVVGVSSDGARAWDAAGTPLERFTLGEGLLAAALAGDNTTVIAADAKHVLHVAASSLVRLIPAHEGMITALAMAPSGTSAITCGADKSVRMWNLADGKPLATFAGPTDAVLDLSLSAGGKQLASANADGSLLVWPVPAAAAAQPVAAQTSISQETPSRSVSLSADGARLISAGDDAIVRVWDLASGRVLQRFAGHTAAVHDVAFFPDGQTLASGGEDKTTQLWTLAASRVVVAAEGKVIDASLAADGTMLALAGEDKKIKLFNTADGAVLHELATGVASPTSVALKSDKTQLAAATDDMKLHRWPLAANGPGAIETVDAPAILTRVHYSVEGNTLAAASADKRLLVYDPADGLLLETSALADVPAALAFAPDGLSLIAAVANDALVQPLSLVRVLRGHEGAATAVDYLPDGSAVVSGGADKTLRQWTLADGAPARTFTGATDAITDLEIAADGSLLAAGSADKFTRVWPLAAAAAATVEPTAAWEHAAGVQGVSVSGDGARVATSADDGVVRVWDVASGRELQRIAAHPMPALAVAISADGSSIVSGSADKTAVLSSVAAHRIFIADATKVSDAAFLPDGSAIAAVGAEMTIKLFDLEGKPLRQTAAAPAALARSAIRDDGLQWAAADIEGRVLLYNAADGALQHTIETGTVIHDLSFSPDHERLVVVGADSHLRVYSTADASLLQDQTAGGPLLAARFAPGGREILTGGTDGAVSQWAFASPAAVAELAGHTGPVYSLAYSGDGKSLASVSSDQSVRIWNRETGEQAQQLAGHAGAVYSVRYSADSSQLLTAGIDGSVRIWNAAGGAAVRTIAPEVVEGEAPPALYDVAVSSDGQTVAAAGADKKIRLFNAANGAPGAVIDTADDAVYRLSFLASGQLLSIGHAGNLALWNAADGVQVFTAKAGGVAYAACPSPTSKQVAIPSADGKTYLILLP